VKKFKNPAGESTFDKVATYALCYLAAPISNADGTYVLDCNFNKNNVKESNEAWDVRCTVMYKNGPQF